MKKDSLIAVIAILVVAGVCYGLAVVRPAFALRPSHPFSAAKVGARTAGRVVLRVNGEPVTEAEYEAAYHLLPQEAQQQYASLQGKMAFAEQLVRMKLLAQEGRRLGLEEDPKVAGLLAAQHTDVMAEAAAEKLFAEPDEQAVRKFYADNKGRFEVLDLNHILIAYAGGTVPPRGGGAAPAQGEAMKKALVAYGELKHGADFAATARKYSDDVASLRQGGELGPISKGMLPQELEAHVFQLPAGQISEPFPSKFGIHIFRVNARSTRPLEQVREMVAQRVRQQDMSNRVEILRKSSKVDFDEKFFPEARRSPVGKKPS